MTGRDIIRAILRNRWRRNFCLPNYTPAKWWECDVFEVTRTGYMREYEVKVSRSDFFADAGKAQEFGGRWTLEGRTPSQVLKKHDLLAAGDARGPASFWYVTPAGLVQPHEVPIWAGLIEIKDLGETDDDGVKRPIAYRYLEHEITPAPRLHREKCPDAIRKRALGVCYWRMHDLSKLHAA